jgi:hypothetical protein
MRGGSRQQPPAARSGSSPPAGIADIEGVAARRSPHLRARYGAESDTEQALRRCVGPEINNFVVLGFRVPDQRSLAALDSQHVGADGGEHLIALRLAECFLVAVGGFI